jgi:hypothetical protein
MLVGTATKILDPLPILQMVHSPLSGIDLADKKSRGNELSRFKGVCGENNKVGSNSKRYCIGNHYARLFLP